MPARKIVSDQILLKWRVEYGLTYPEIIEENYKITGHRVTKSAVSRLLKRLKQTKPRIKYEDTLPWVVEERHRKNHIVQMLQAQGRRARGLPLRAEIEKNLASWERKLLRADAVVDYVPDSIENVDGFIYRRRMPQDGDGWVRRPTQSNPPDQTPEPIPQLTPEPAPEPTPEPAKIPTQTRPQLRLVKLFSDAPS